MARDDLGDLFDKATDLYPEKVGKVDKKALREDIRRRLKENGSDVATTGWAKDG